MTQEKFGSIEPAETGQPSTPRVMKGAPGESPAKIPSTPSSFLSGTSSPHAANTPFTETPGSAQENTINKELRRLNRALRALSACNHALAHAGSEQELLQQICDIIVEVGGYRMAAIAYAEQDEEKTVRPMARAGRDSGYLDSIQVRWSDTPEGRGPAGTAIREDRICLIADTQNDPDSRRGAKQHGSEDTRR